MSLSALRRLANPMFLRFNNVNLDIVDHQGKPWVTAEDAGRCLEYADPAVAIRVLYNRNKDHFGPNETALIELEVEIDNPTTGVKVTTVVDAKVGDYPCQSDTGSQAKKTHKRKIKVRIFSLRGLNRLGIYARTEVGNKFHNWILDLLEGHGRMGTLMNDHSRMIRWFFERRPRWKQIHDLFVVCSYSFEEIARRVEITPASVRRAVNLMHKRGVISDIDHERGIANAQEMLSFWRERGQERAARQLGLAF